MSKPSAPTPEIEEGEFILAAMGMADGLGSETRFHAWIEQLLGEITWHWLDAMEGCTQAWAASRQEARRAVVGQVLAEKAQGLTWPAWLRVEALIGKMKLDAPTRQPELGSLAREILDSLDSATAASSRQVAAGRVLSRFHPGWPLSPREVGLLHLWPGHRRIGGLRVQLALSCGASSHQIRPFAHRCLVPPTWHHGSQDTARHLVRDIARDMASGMASGFASYWIRYLARDFASYWTRYLASDFASDWGRGLARDSASYWAHHLVRSLVSGWASDLASGLARHLACYGSLKTMPKWARDWARDSASYGALDLETPWLEDFIIQDFMAFGVPTLRSTLAYLGPKEPLMLLLTPACRLSLHPDRNPTELEQALKRYREKVDPLWPALARHLTRRSTEEDRALLEDLAQHPEKREPPLSWGLKYIVRGDLLFEDGSEMTLDELCDEVGIPRLPYLEDMPDELEIDWEE